MIPFNHIEVTIEQPDQMVIDANGVIGSHTIKSIATTILRTDNNRSSIRD